MKHYPDSAVIIAKKAMYLYNKLGNVEKTVEASIICSESLKQVGFYDKAMICIDSVLKSLHDKKYLHLKAKCYNKLGEISRANHLYDGGLSHLFEALKIATEINNQDIKANAYNRISAIYYEKMEYGLATAYADSSLAIAQSINSFSLVMNNNDILAAIFRKKKEYNKSLELEFKMLKIADQVDDVENNKLNIYLNIARAYYYMENYPEAIRYGEICYKKAVDLNIMVYCENSVTLLANVYAKSKLFEQAYKYSRIRSNLRYKIEKRQYEHRMAELNAKYQTERKEHLIHEKNNELLKNRLNLKNEKARQKILIVALIGLFVAILLLGIFYYNKRKNYRKISQQNKIISSKNQELEQLSAEIKAQANQLAKSNLELSTLQDFKENMTSTYVHDLKNALNSIIHFAKKNEILKPARKMLNLVLNILDVQKYESDKIQLELHYCFLNEILYETIENVSLLMEEKNITINKKFDKNTRLLVDKNIIVRVFENLLINAIKFSPVNAAISIESYQHSNGIIIIKIVDQGIGIPKENLELIFKKNKQAKVKKSGSIISTGLGLMFCKMAVEGHGGTIYAMNNTKMPGATFAFTLTGDYNTNDAVVNTIISDKSEITLTSNEQIKLQPVISELLKHHVYEASDIFNILRKVDDSSTTVISWKNIVTSAVLASNDILYERLLKKIENMNEAI